MDAGFKLNSKQTDPIIPSLINQMVFTKVVNLTSEKQIDSVISSGLVVTPKHSFYILKIASEHYLQDQLRYEKDFFLKFKDVVYKEKNNVIILKRDKRKGYCLSELLFLGFHWFIHNNQNNKFPLKYSFLSKHLIFHMKLRLGKCQKMANLGTGGKLFLA